MTRSAEKSSPDDEECGEEQSKQCKVTTSVEPVWLEKTRAMTEYSSYFAKLQKKSKEGALPNSHYKEVNGIWFYKKRIFLDPLAAAAPSS